MSRPRTELERLTQNVERVHPDWLARQVERELEALAPVVYGHWKDETPSLEARLRQVQRWRKGFRSPPRPRASPLYRHIWPVGERQRQELDPQYIARPTRLKASHRVFLRNCSPDSVQELRARLAGEEVAYEPSLLPGHFVEVDWSRHEELLRWLLESSDHATRRCKLSVEFATDRGTRSGRFDGELDLDSTDGWQAFVASDGSRKEIE
ncbi:MAG: hypothetical protein L3K10_03175 [Thermoplasmata archaeon]|nr:hypothetical protein [Thermoplasmata archaeon]